MQEIILRERLTHRYVDTARHRDLWGPRFLARMTTPRLVREPTDEPSDAGTYIAHVVAPAGAPDLTRAVRDSLSHEGCDHEYDCCGCASHRARVLHKSGGRRGGRTVYVVRISSSRNY